MAYIDEIAYNLGRRDEVPNQELARRLASEENVTGLDEMASYLYDKNKSVASDCLKVLYEAGYIRPDLISKYVDTYLDLLSSKNNRMVWGAMIAIWNIAAIEHEKIYARIDLILNKIKTGSLITHVTGIKVLLVLASVEKDYYDNLYPILLDYLKACRPIDFGKRVEDYMVILNDDNKDDLLDIVRGRFDGLNKNQTKRVTKAFKSKNIVL
ncbi:hypothetical protein EZV73_19000 [Acidaminobacter sp. JC074]|uniref:hypothetical protein n=1 Tax=Acidaminobacter sp. JC074 TaxID=2530199 RepID=UPI001F0D9100|nr:hypothetical protein [Acidaminobacter sp. JC074]MCH4889678.1 hypothetical protein [Acidaminobacter sp. JC074]